MMNIKIQAVRSFHQLGMRDNQEDARYPDTDVIPSSQRFFVVCDGVGGSQAGEVASHAVCKAFAAKLHNTDFANADFTNAAFAEALGCAYDALDRIDNGQGSDIATTLTFCAFHKEGCTLAHIGDSHIYHIRPGQGILYRSDDHSLVNQMVHSGIITPEEAIEHPQRNVITRCMSPVDDDQSRCSATVYRTTDIKESDRLLLCTDGVLHNVSDKELHELVSSNKDIDEVIATLAAQCYDSPDNNTAILIHIGEVGNDDASNNCVSAGNNDDSQQPVDSHSHQKQDPDDTQLHRDVTTTIEEVLPSPRCAQPKGMKALLKGIINDKLQLPHPRGTIITDKNLTETAIYLAVRHSIEATWINDRDQFLFPNDGWKQDMEFHTDCLVYTLFHGQNRIGGDVSKRRNSKDDTRGK